MRRTPESTEPARRRVAVTGATGDLGHLLLPLLENDPKVESILALDLARPDVAGPKVEFQRIDLVRPEADRQLVEAIREHRIDTFFHLAFLWSPIQNAAAAHELEVLGSMHVLAAIAEFKPRRLIVPSLTAVYGAQTSNSAFIREGAQLHGCPTSRFITDRVEVERMVASFAPRHPETSTLVLRFAPIVGPSVNNPVTRFLKARVVPTLLGFDPLWQAIHEEDAARALHLALHSDATGELNVVGRGVVSLSGMVKLAGGNVVPLPHPVARSAIRVMNSAGALAVPVNLLDYIQYSWVADGRRAEQALGFVPRFHARDAVGSVQRSA